MWRQRDRAKLVAEVLRHCEGLERENATLRQQLKKAESGSGNTKMPKMELTISVNGVTIQDPKSKEVKHEYPLHRISYCADDKEEKRFFSFIAKDEHSNKHTCFVFLSDKLVRYFWFLNFGILFNLSF